MAEETNPTPESSSPQASPKAPVKEAKEKKAKPPALEDKPFNEFIEQHFNPSLEKAFQAEGISDVKLQLTKQSVPIKGANPSEQCWQVIGNWQNGKRQFNLYFLEENISGQKAFSASTDGSQPSTIESFMIDERKVTLDLMVMYTIQRLNGQKWLFGN
jgi:hypothetical protein